jgi:hypothetical protein
MNLQTTRRLAAAAMSAAALLAIAGFTALGSIFEYPQILKEPTTDILASYREHQGEVVGWFVVLMISAAMLAPVGLLLARLVSAKIGRWIAIIGIAGATVQVVGLSRWVVLIPGVSADATVPAQTAEAHHKFEQLHYWLGTVVGETIGYALTATFTALIVTAITRRIAPRWMAVLGYASAALIATGVIVPVVGAASITNFAGYVIWCLWLIAMAVVLWRARPSSRTTSIRPHADARDGATVAS